MECSNTPLFIAAIVSAVVAITMQFVAAWWYARSDRLERYKRYEDAMKNYNDAVKKMKERNARNDNGEKTQ